MATATSARAEDAVQGSIGLWSQLSQSVGNVPGNRSNADFNLDYYKNKPDELERRFTLASLYNDQGLLMYSLQEAYVAAKPTNKDTFKIGRQILPWSTVDATWGFGKLNNRRNFNYFEPGQEGLIGLSYERASSNGMRYRFFGSGLYVPETNPPLDIDKKKKTITSRSPWADVPARTADTGTGQKTIQYDVNYPSVSEIIYRYSVGANIGWESEHWSVDGFVMRKPENQISSKVDVAYDAVADVVKASVTPQFYYHDVFGGNLKYRNQDLQMYVSGIGIRPNTFPDGNDQATRYTEIKTEKRREDYVGGGISKINEVYGMGFNYVARLSPFDRDRDSLAVDPRWNQAVDFFLMRAIGDLFRVSGDLKYDMLTTDRLVMLRGYFQASKNFLVSLGVNMIGTPSNGKSYWSPYTNNDAFYGSVRYVF